MVIRNTKSIAALVLLIAACSQNDFSSSSGGGTKRTTTTNPGGNQVGRTTLPNGGSATTTNPLNGATVTTDPLGSGGGSNGGGVTIPNLSSTTLPFSSTTVTVPTTVNVPSNAYGDFYLVGNPGDAKYQSGCLPSNTTTWGACEMYCRAGDAIVGGIGDCGPWNPSFDPVGLASFGQALGVPNVGCMGHRRLCSTPPAVSPDVVVDVKLRGTNCSSLPGYVQTGSIASVALGSTAMTYTAICKNTKPRSTLVAGEQVVVNFRFTPQDQHAQTPPACNANEVNVGAMYDCANDRLLPQYAHGCVGWQTACVTYGTAR